MQVAEIQRFRCYFRSSAIVSNWSNAASRSSVISCAMIPERATKWIPVKTVRIVAAGIYAVLGVLTLLGYSSVNLG
jgi:hypothetical protein